MLPTENNNLHLLPDEKFQLVAYRLVTIEKIKKAQQVVVIQIDSILGTLIIFVSGALINCIRLRKGSRFRSIEKIACYH